MDVKARLVAHIRLKALSVAAAMFCVLSAAFLTIACRGLKDAGDGLFIGFMAAGISFTAYKIFENKDLTIAGFVPRYRKAGKK